jgi:predicted cation transporter
LSLVATVYSGFTQDFGFSTVNTVLNIPIGIQEMVLAVWLIVKGFNPSIVRSIASEAGDISRPGVPVFGAARVAGTD